MEIIRVSKTIENLKTGNYKVIDNQGVSVTGHFIECLEKEFADLENALKLACEKCLSFPCSDYCSSDDECDNCFYKKEYTPEKFKEKAKEMRSE